MQGELKNQNQINRTFTAKKMITQTQTYSLCSILTFPARITTEAVSWVVYSVSTKPLDSAYILNDTTFVHINYTSGHTPYEITYHFHKFPYKPDSSVAYQWW